MTVRFRLTHTRYTQRGKVGIRVDPNGKGMMLIRNWVAKTRALPLGLLTVGVLLFVGPSQAATYSHPTDNYTLTYPDLWFLDLSGAAGANGLLIIRNCPRSDMLRGGILPQGAAQIGIAQMPPETNELEYGQKLQMSDTTAVVNPTPPVRITRISHWSDGDAKITEVYLRQSGKLILFSMTYRVSDPLADSYESVLTSIVSSVSVP